MSHPGLGIAALAVRWRGCIALLRDDLRLWSSPERPVDSRFMNRVLGAAVAGGVLLAAGRRWRDWGATKAECGRRLPGDELVAEPADVTTRAVTIHAPAEQVWPWLAQIGQDRAGLYSYDWLENLLGLRIHSVGEIHEEWQHLQVGDTVRLVPAGWLGMRGGVALPVARVDPGRALVLRQQPPALPWNAVWSFHLVPKGPARCRLISRSRSARRGRLARLAAQLMDPIALVMTRRMLLGIKARAERHQARSAVEPW
jgi:hypothetical protein